MDDDFWGRWPGVILGHEDPDAAGDSSDSSEEDPEGEGETGSTDSTDSTGETSGEETDLEKLQKALNAERRNSKKLERELRKERNVKAAVSQEENDTVEEAKQREAAALARSEKLAAGILKRDIDSAIREAAREAKFIDVEDAVNGVDRTKITFDQDDEDPTDIDIDLTTVSTVVKALAAKKQHFIRKGTNDGEATGSAHGGTRRRKTQTPEEVYAERYPSL